MPRPVDPDFAAQVPGATRMVVHLLYQRGYRTADEIQEFFSSPVPDYDPYLMPDMHRAVGRIRAALESRQRIAIYGDFDCDGLTASAAMSEMLQLLGNTPEVVIPTRTDGHGMQIDRLRMLADSGTKLVISADCGIVDIEPTRVARELGMDVIITDHHQSAADGSLPDCPVVSPSRHDSSYPWPYLSGAGVVFKVIQAMMGSAEDTTRFLDLIALGTVADVVPLRDENRGLVIKGLDCLRDTKRCGLRALFNVAGVDSRRLTQTSVSYYLAPRINSANRMADPQLAYDLFAATDPARANEIAGILNEHNAGRQHLVARNIDDIIEGIGDEATVALDVQSGKRAPILCVRGEWPAGVSGLLASQLTERYGLPAIVASPRDKGVYSASGRSVNGVNILSILEACDGSAEGVFLRHGGHSAACGFTVPEEAVGVAFEKLEEAAREIVAAEQLGSVLLIDARVKLGQINMQSVKTVESLAPYGEQFQEPIFVATGVYLRRRRRMGSNAQHIRMTARTGNASISAIMFNCDEELAAYPENQPLDLAVSIERNEWEDQMWPQIRIHDWRPFTEL
jgi:single-stranded-DNA-specific exonuclease